MPEEVQSLLVDQILTSPYQPRRRFDAERLAELAVSIRQQGLLQPILVRPLGTQFELIAGERRLRAVRSLGWNEIPALVRRYTNEQALEAALIENLQREDISVVEEAQAYRRLLDEFGYAQAEIAQQTGKSRATISNTLRILQLPPGVLDLLDAGELSEGHGRALLALPYPSLQLEVAEWIVRNAVTVRETELKVRSLLKTPEVSPTSGTTSRQRDANLDALEEQLRRHFGTRTSLTYRRGRGSLNIEFYSEDDLQRILELLGLSD
jgi:ParB family chromosome partitioning protein